jgi:NIMA (never in mitosis gene a)-related kinase
LSVNPKYYIPESEVWRAVRDILSGLAVLHDTSILHRDIKAANIFKSDGIYKLGDLNIAKLCPGLAYAYTQTGTPYYASPEVWK